SWDDLTDRPGLPDGVRGKVGVSVSPADPDRVWAIIEAEDGGVFRSDDGGETWERTNDERKLRQRAFYYTRIYADTEDADRVYVVNVGFFRSDDAGETFDTRISVPHGDNHDLWIASDDNRRMINANDGGANVSFNGGETWTDQDYSTAQFYHVTTTRDIPYHVCGAQQDNSTVCMPGDGGPDDFYPVAGGESGYIAAHPERPNITYGGSYGGYLNRYDRETGIRAMVNVWPDNPMGYSAEDMAERFQWTYPIVFDPHDPEVLYATSQHVWQTADGGQSWERISPDLTLAADSTMGPSGGPVTKDQTGVETYATIFSLAPSPVRPGLLWAGSDDGLIHITRDGGGSWTDVTPPGMPEHTRVSMIEASPHSACRAYVAGNRYLLGDLEPYAWRTDDCGETWVDIAGGMPTGDFTRAVREDVVRPRMLYAATERGVWVSWDDGARWQSLSRNLPVVQVADLVVEDRDLVIATHGRGFWIMDDIGPLRQLNEAVATADVHLFEPADPVLGVHGSLRVAYHLEQAVDSVAVEVLDAEGEVVQRFRGEPADSAEDDEAEDEEPGRRGGGGPTVAVDEGLHSVTWNLRYPGATGFPGMILWAASTRVGPEAPPGSYTVRLVADGVTQSYDFRVQRDPRLPDVTGADLRERFRFSMEIRDRVSEANDAVRLIRGIEEQLEARLDARPDDEELTSVVAALEASLDDVEGEIYQVRNRSNQDPLNYPIKLNNKLAALMGVVQGNPGRPTAQSYEVFEVLADQLDTQRERLSELLETDLRRLNGLLEARGLDPVERVMIPEEAPDGDEDA
ncbi:MAG: WD40/YVTN/BNR-like repeat-containing protein, partial [Gemmatimonadota bacterium]